MCGIAGLIRVDGAPVDEGEIVAMNALLRHRGPDSCGVHVAGSVGLGHTRLAVMDPTPAGHQPMSYADGRYWVSYNGEVYNFLEIRETLEGLGHRFRGESDTEVVIAAFAEWGPDCQFRFNGEWAFAVWDARENTLFLSRDRFGVKPLYYYFDGTRFAFASEMKAFLGLPWFDAAFDERAVAAALVNVQAFEGTEIALLRDVKRLPGGHCLRLTLGEPPRIERWWRTLDHLPDVPAGIARQAERLRELLFDACAIRMRSDIPLGTGLSGGLDSSAVHCAMAHLSAQGGHRPRQAESWDRAIVGLLPGWDENDRTLAEDVIAHAGTQGLFRPLRPEDALDRLDELILHFEQVAPVPVGQWVLYGELRRSNILVSMEGHGADEAFAGFRDNPKIAFLDGIERLHGYVAAMEKIGIRDPAELPDPRLLAAVGQLPAGRVGVRVGKTAGSEFVTARPYALRYPIWDQDLRDLNAFDALTRVLYLQFHCSRTPWILHDFEAASMANGVETRAPFLDWRIICYGFALPVEAKIRDGVSKFIVREAMRGHMPESVRTRGPKVGFPLPLYAWLKDALKPYVFDCVTSQAFLESAIWNGPAVKGQVDLAYANQDFGRLRHLWPYVQADRLMAAFADRAAELRRTAPLAKAG